MEVAFLVQPERRIWVVVEVEDVAEEVSYLHSEEVAVASERNESLYSEEEEEVTFMYCPFSI